MISNYNAYKIEKKWQKEWEKKKLYITPDKVAGKDNFYALVEFPYPSGNLHTGHWYAFSIPDIFVRLKRMQGKNVLFPMGFDAFGLPAENAALKHRINPKKWTYSNIAYMRKQFKSMGAAFDWSREVITSDPDYYKWTQWMFIQMYKAGLAYKKKTLANWCPKDQVILANEQVIDGKCWRHPDTTVIQREVDQWLLKITEYADDLINGLEKLNWPERTKLMQKNWIGKSEGDLIKFRITNSKFQEKKYIEVFTTRPDTLFGATYLVLSPEHPLVEQITTKDQKEKVRHYITNAHLKTELERTSLEKEKTGVFTGSYALNPVNNEEIPIWISDYVLMNYGTGAIMAVPAHDERDFEFAKKFNLPIIRVIDPGREWPADKPYSEGGLLINSGEFTGLESAEARKQLTKWLENKGLGSLSTQYKMRDWIISRQRYWGAPIPIIYCSNCGIITVPEKDLPVKLPQLNNFKPVAGGKSPLNRVKRFVNTKCPKCKSRAIRETDTMDTFVDSSWYFLRYTDPKNKKQFASREKMRFWMPVKLYSGGAEHTTMHLLYSRFFMKALYNMGLVEWSEPYLERRNRGLLLGPDGQKMSKSRGNVIDPDELVRKYGADTVRMYLGFMGEYSQGGPWNPKGILGIKRFLDKIWNKFQTPTRQLSEQSQAKPDDKLQILLNQTIKKVGEDISDFRFNTAISALMILFNAIENENVSKNTMEIFLKLLAPFAPHFTEELWRQLKNKKSIHMESWPKYDPKLVESDEYELIIQINGKMRDKLRISNRLEKPDVENIVLKRESIVKHIGNAQIKKIIFVPNRLINIVV